MDSKTKIIVLTGPTASGKSDLAVRLASEFPLEIISADSVQVYRLLNIGSAKPPPSVLASVPHHLVDLLDLEEEYNAGIFAKQASEIIEGLTSRGKIALVTGGTGLYVKALLKGLIPTPRISGETKNRVGAMMLEKGVEECHRELSLKDPLTAKRLRTNDKQRISRALEVYLETGQSLAEMQDEHSFAADKYRVLTLGIFLEREENYRRINERVLHMVDGGLIQETASILEKGYSPDLKPLNSIGYRQSVRHLRGELGFEAMIGEIQTKTRNYAKRQLTWHSSNPDIQWMKPQQANQAIALCREFLEAAF